MAISFAIASRRQFVQVYLGPTKVDVFYIVAYECMESWRSNYLRNNLTVTPAYASSQQQKIHT